MRIKMLEKVGVLHDFTTTLDRPFCSSLSWNLQRKKRVKLSSAAYRSRFPLQRIDILATRFPEAEKISPPLLQLSEVTFGYKPENLLLQGINIDVGLDSRIAIVGANGAGKSTL